MGMCVVCTYMNIHELVYTDKAAMHAARARMARTCVAVCCSVLQCVAVCCSVLQCVAVCCSALL